MARFFALLISLCLSSLIWGCASKRPPTDMAAMRQKAEAEFSVWLASPETQKLIAQQKLEGEYIYTLVINHRGQVQTVYADENAEGQNLARQNDMTRLLRGFTSTIRLAPNERIKFQPRFKV